MKRVEPAQAEALQGASPISQSDRCAHASPNQSQQAPHSPDPLPVWILVDLEVEILRSDPLDGPVLDRCQEGDQSLGLETDVLGREVVEGSVERAGIDVDAHGGCRVSFYYCGAPASWRRAETVRVVRRAPVPTAAGKILPFPIGPR